jgi:hypothetical protein
MMRTQDAALHLATGLMVLTPAWWSSRDPDSHDPFVSVLTPLLDVVPFSVLATVLGVAMIPSAYALLNNAAEWIAHRMVLRSLNKLARKSAVSVPSAEKPQQQERTRLESALELASDRHERLRPAGPAPRAAPRVVSTVQRRADDSGLALPEGLVLGEILAGPATWSEERSAAADVAAESSSGRSDASTPSFEGGGGDRCRRAGEPPMRVALVLVHLVVVWSGFGAVLWSEGSQVWTGACDLSNGSAELWFHRAALLTAGVMYLVAIQVMSVPFSVFWAGIDALRTPASEARKTTPPS